MAFIMYRFRDVPRYCLKCTDLTLLVTVILSEHKFNDVQYRET